MKGWKKRGGRKDARKGVMRRGVEGRKQCEDVRKGCKEERSARREGI
jgi:hypothetical protein